jgi:hypothetical protein
MDPTLHVQSGWAFKHWHVFLLITGILSGCQTKQTVTKFEKSEIHLNRPSTVYVAIPEHPGRDSERTYPGSDFQTAEACAQAFGKFAQVKLGRRAENVKQSLSAARDEKCDYVIKPEIRVWEDNPTEWTGERDELEIDLEIIDAASGNTISRSALKGKSRWLSGGDKPERMLIGFFEPYVAELFGAANQ